MQKKEMKLYLITNMPASYRVDLFNLLQERLGTGIRFCFIHESGIDFKKGIGIYENENFLQQSCFYNGRHFFSIVKFFFDLLKYNPDVIINGGMSNRALFLCVFAKLFRKKMFIWWGGTALVSKNISCVKSLYRRLIATMADGGLFYSKLAYDDYSKLTIKQFPNIIIGNNTRDTASYREKVLSLKKKSGSNKVKLLTVGFLTEGKNVIACLEALKLIDGDVLDYELLIVGDGPERSRLEKFCFINKLKNVFFLGHVTPADMYRIYGDADIYIHPSLRDRWPQTYNEAAAAGLSILISSHSGLSNEYTEEYKDIEIFDPNDYETIAARIVLLANNRSLRKEIGKKALECAMKHDAAYACERILSLCQN
jgi:glycosyltransferase involved in cell wall biosynthesis